MSNHDPQFFLISPRSPVEDLDVYFQNKPESYKTRGAVGDKAYYSGLFHKGEGVVVEITGNQRSIRNGSILATQRWVGGKYWLDEGVIFTAETR